MASKKKLLQAAAGSAGGAVLDVDEVFSTYLYDGTGSAQTITNSIDLAGEGGLVWTKTRSSNQYGHRLIDEGSNVILSSDVTNGALNGSLSVTQYYLAGQSNGFNLVGSQFNVSGQEYVSWTWRKAPKFFDIVTYSGNGATRTISHNLGSDVGMLIVKRTDASAPWAVWHRQLNGGTNSGQYYIWLNSTNSEAASSPYWNNTAPTSTEFTVSSDGHVNNASGTYVAYLFAHNDGDGNFGPDADQDIIKCGSYAGQSSGGTDIDVNLGFEPQWLLLKPNASASWYILDNMRGIATGGNSERLFPNNANAESSTTGVALTPTGFTVTAGSELAYASGYDIIYMAIRRGPLAAPESATDVFTAVTNGTPDSTEFRPENVDMAMFAKRGGDSENFQIADRVRGFQSTSLNSDDGYTTPTLETNNTNAEDTSSTSIHQTEGQGSSGGPYVRSVSSGSNFLMYRWKRAPSYFDVVAYTGTGLSSVNTVSHNLGVVPEMIWTKRRSGTGDWNVYHKGLNGGTNPEQYIIVINSTNAEQNRTYFNDTAPTATTFEVTDSANGNGDDFIAYLFATVAGVSKVGSYTGNGSTQNIDCGFSSGARFVLIKCSSDGLTDWHVMDSTRGIVAGNDPFLYLNNTTAEDTGEDMIDPYSSGFALAANNRVNTNGRTYIFYAIA